ncbi:hypothetical protein SETIT_4G047200v2 [Setaria italica]|uniref:Uncharacterized protein n=1 Tax=Setaria italica TaxID=4555 RepID=A0A368QQS8_SETIT|nr:hypothetical protein SETIT_4G047200v2 [Setaria italica]
MAAGGRERDGAVLPRRLHHVHEAAVVHERRPHEHGRAPPEVGVVQRHAHPADGAEVRPRDAAPGQVHGVHPLQVVHQRPRVVVALARRRERAPRRVAHGVRHHLPGGGGDRRPDHRVAEVARGQRRRQARAHVDHGVEPRLGVVRQRPRPARALPHQRHHRAERGRPRAPRLERRHLRLGQRDDGARVGGGRCRDRVRRRRLGLVLRVVVQHRGRRPRAEEPVVEAWRQGRGVPAAAGDARPRLDEVRGAPGVDDGVVQGEAKHDAAAAQAGELREQQRARRVRSGGGRHEQRPHLVARHELAEQVVQRGVRRPRRHEHRALARAVDLDAPGGGVGAEAAGERVERDERPREAVPDGAGLEELRPAVGPVEVDRGRVPAPRGEVEVGQPHGARRRLLRRDDQLRRQPLHRGHRCDGGVRGAGHPELPAADLVDEDDGDDGGGPRVTREGIRPGEGGPPPILTRIRPRGEGIWPGEGGPPPVLTRI